MCNHTNCICDNNSNNSNNNVKVLSRKNEITRLARDKHRCNYCNKIFKHQTNARRHIKNDCKVRNPNKNNSKKGIFETLCGKVYTSQKRLDNHVIKCKKCIKALEIKFDKKFKFQWQEKNYLIYAKIIQNNS